MDETQTYLADSLELHLFFARIMKEHALFLKVGFQPPGENFAKEGERFLRQFESLLSRTIGMSNHVISTCVLDSGELFTEFTECAERQTQRLTGTYIDRELTARMMKLQGLDCGEDMRVSGNMCSCVSRLNRDALRLVNGLIDFKKRLICEINDCCLFTTNYPQMLEHILREARLYRANILRLEGMRDDDIDQLHDSEWFWNRIMMEHALFIRGLLDPTEEKLVNTANDFAGDYRQLLDAATTVNDRMMDSSAQTLTEKFRDFKRAGVEGIEDCEIRSIILPLLADHVLREANHYLRLLGK